MSRTLQFTFKLVFTANVWQLDIDSSMTTAEFITYINEDTNLRQLFNIHQHYHIDIVKAGNIMYRQAELAPSIMVSFSETVGEKFNPQSTSFYLRPVHPITEEFIRRDDYSVAPNYTQPSTPERQTPEMDVVISPLNSETNLEEINPML
jgi:hypothetical protein